MGYCFMHIDKVKSVAQMKNDYTHNFRLVEVANANPQLSCFNDEIVSLNGRSYEDAFNDTLISLKLQNGAQKNLRANGVYALDIVMTMSLEDAERIDIEEWKKANVEWLKQTFNPPEKRGRNGEMIEMENVKSVIFHGDEAGAPHLHAFVIPVDDKGKLNASYYDGPGKYRELQNSYAKAMANFGLDRGLEGSVAKHNDVKRYYTALNKVIADDLPEPLKNETITQYRQRANEIYHEAKLKAFGENEKLQRALVETKTISKNYDLSLKTELIQKDNELRSIKKEIEKQNDKFFHITGIDKDNEMDTPELIREVRHDIEEIRNIKKAVMDYPDKEFTQKFEKDYEYLLLWQQQRVKHNKRKNREKEIVDVSILKFV